LRRVALGISYVGSSYHGWQSQIDGQTVQDHLERALTSFAAAETIKTVCAGRTDTGVHALMQVVHFDTHLQRPASSWVRGTNRYLPDDISVQWAQEVEPSFHSRFSAIRRRYAYIVLESPTRPALEHGRVGWVHYPLELEPMEQAAKILVGEHDFSSFRASACQALSPIKQLYDVRISRKGAYWRFDFEGNAFLHHMVRNIMGCLLAVGQGRQPSEWMSHVLAAKSRKAAAPTFSANGLYFLGPVYDAQWRLPVDVAAADWLPL